MQQVVAPNPNIPCTPGWCLTYVQTAWGAPWSGSSATDAWNRAQKQHTDGFPSGVDVPVYFTMIGNPNGHIAILMQDGSVYSASAPNSTTPVHHANLQALYSYYGGRLSLRGWSEDLNGFILIKEQEEDDMLTEDLAALMWVSNMDISLDDPAWQRDTKPYWCDGKHTAVDFQTWLMNTPTHTNIIEHARAYSDPTDAQDKLDQIKTVING